MTAFTKSCQCMEQLFANVNNVFAFVIPVSDFFWDFPTNISFYKSIPVLGNFSLAVLLLLGAGLYFTIRTGFIQATHFGKGIHILAYRKSGETGISPLAAFLLSSAMRVGPGNILGVTGAISVGGPGALFWMWVSATVGMATAYTEAVLAQIFKEKKNDEFVGGLPFYGRKLLGDLPVAGIVLSVMYIVYAMCCIPAQGFNVVSSITQMGSIVVGYDLPVAGTFTYAVALLVVIFTAWIAFGGIKAVTRITNGMVPVMAILYMVIVLGLVVLNLDQLPYFFAAVFGGAFTPEAIFGGAFGLCIVQGVKRGLMSNEAGQGTITMAAACSDAKHPCEQGIVQAIGVFLDTHVICTLTGFVVIMAHLWNGTDGAGWMALGKLPRFLASAQALVPVASLSGVISFLLTFCFCLFALTCLIGMISFSEIAANRISRSTTFISGIRLLGIFITTFGIVCSLAGIDLGNLWSISDLGNILIVFANLPLLMLGAKYVLRATEHYKLEDGSPFSMHSIGWTNGPLWWDSHPEICNDSDGSDGHDLEKRWELN